MQNITCYLLTGRSHKLESKEARSINQQGHAGSRLRFISWKVVWSAIGIPQDAKKFWFSHQNLTSMGMDTKKR